MISFIKYIISVTFVQFILNIPHREVCVSESPNVVVFFRCQPTLALHLLHVLLVRAPPHFGLVQKLFMDKSDSIWSCMHKGFAQNSRAGAHECLCGRCMPWKSPQLLNYNSPWTLKMFSKHNIPPTKGSSGPL